MQDDKNQKSAQSLVDEDLAEIRKLLEQEKFDEARVLIEEFFGEKLTPEESGKAYLNIAEMYLDIATHFGKQKKELLTSALSAVEDLDKKTRKLDDLIDLQKVRAKIQGE